MEITLDTNKNCFICLQTIPKAEKKELCLTNICRFLQINISEVLMEGLSEGDKDIDAFHYNLLKKCNFSVALCNPCYRVAGKLSSIIHDLEVAHLQVNYYSEVFQNILEKADLTFSATKKTCNSETADSRMVEHLRKKAKQKCFARNRKALATNSRLPLVKLNRLTKETVTRMTNKCALACITPSTAYDVGVDISLSHNSTGKYKYSESFGIVGAPIYSGVLVDASAEINEDGTENTMGLRHDLVTEHEYKLVEEENSPRKDENYGMTFPKSDPQVVPISGGSSLDITLSQRNSSEDHQLMSCSESLNSNAKMSYPVVERVVVEDWILCPNKQESPESQILEDPQTCDDWNDGVVVETENGNESFCLQQMPEEEGHVANKRKIVVIEENLNRFDSPVCGVAEERTKDRLACLHCESIFLQPLNLQLHMISFHLDQIFLSYKPAHMSASQFADSCRKILERETLAYTDNQTIAVPRQCSYCTEMRRYKQDYLKHLVNSHRKIIGEKITTFENDVSEQVEFIGDTLAGVASSFTVTEDKISTNQVTKTPKSRFDCNHCKSRFSFSLRLQLHMISHHPDQVFLCYKPVRRTESQFADSCREIFQKETVGYSNDAKKTIPRQCAYCAKVHRYKQDFLRHLVYSHKKIMGEKIKVNSTNHVPQTSKRRFACNHCKRIFPRSECLRYHMISHHPDQIFLSFKPAHRSESQFANSCRKIFERETIGYVYSHNPNKPVPRQCSYCTEIRRYKPTYLKHLVYSHREIIGEKIRAFENEEEQRPLACVVAEEIKTSRKAKSSAGKACKGRFSCIHCNKRFHKHVPLRLHMVRDHPDQILSAYKPAHRSESQFADSCRKILESESVGYSSSSKKKTAPRQCSYCTDSTEMRRYKIDYLRHLIYSHTKIIGGKIRALENEDSQQVGFMGGSFSEDARKELHVGLVETENCDESGTEHLKMESGQSQVAHGPHLGVVAEKKKIKSTSQTAKTSKGRFTCNYCIRRFPVLVSLRYHMLRFHPDQIFLSYKPVHRSESQFADSCREIFQREALSYSDIPEKAVPRQCSYCKEIHRFKKHYLRHLVYSHTKIIGGKIKRFANGESQIGEDAMSGGNNQQIPILQGSTLMEGEMKMNSDQRKSKSSQFTCSHCKKRFIKSYNLRLHLISFHPDQIFLSVKPAHRSESQFADSCRKIFERETATYGNATKKLVPQQCAYCTEMRWYKQDYLKHLVYSHTSIMRERIRAFENEEAQVGFLGTLSGDAWNEWQVETQYCNQTIDSKQMPCKRSQLNCAAKDNHSYPVVAPVEEVNQKISSAKDTCTELWTAGDWNDVEVESTMIKPEDYGESSSNCVPTLVDPLLIDEFNNCSATNATMTPVSSCDTDTKYDNGFV